MSKWLNDSNKSSVTICISMIHLFNCNYALNVIVSNPVSSRWVLYFKKINVSAFSGRRRQQCSLMTSLAVLKSLSEGTLVGGGARNFWASVVK